MIFTIALLQCVLGARGYRNTPRINDKNMPYTHTAIPIHLPTHTHTYIHAHTHPSTSLWGLS